MVGRQFDGEKAHFYLTDGVYVCKDAYGNIILRTGDHRPLHCDQEIVLDPSGHALFNDWVKENC